MVFPHDFNIVTNFYVLLGIADQVADQADVSSIGQLYQNHDVGSFISQRFMHRMPDPFKRIDFAVARTLRPAHVTRAAFMTDPLRTELKAAARMTALH